MFCVTVALIKQGDMCAAERKDLLKKGMEKNKGSLFCDNVLSDEMKT